MLDQEEEIALNEFQKLEEKLSAKQGEKDSRCVWGLPIPVVSMEIDCFGIAWRSTCLCDDMIGTVLRRDLFPALWTD